MLDNIEWLGHSTIKIKFNNIVIYIDPYNIYNKYSDADIIFITHNHYDHFSKEDINKIKKDTTNIVITEDLYNDVLGLGFSDNTITVVKPYNNYFLDNVEFSTVPSYNINKQFHPKENNWVGYIITLNNTKYYIAGDTDITEENSDIKCDVAFLPIGGTYTMDYKDAAELANIIKSKIVVPIHYGNIVGTIEDALKFNKLIDKSIKCVIM